MRHDLETLLRTTLVDAEASAPAPYDLAERLLAGTLVRRPAPAAPKRSARRFVPPLLAAVLVVGLAIAVAIARIGGSGSHHPPATRLPMAPFPTGFQATDVYFADSLRGWALGDGACRATPGCAALLRTADGGHHWQAVPVPTGLASTRACVTTGPRASGSSCARSVVFADERHGYLWGNDEIFATSDGGSTWHSEHRVVVGIVVAGSRAVTAGTSIWSAPAGTLRWTAHATGDRYAVQIVAAGDTAYVRYANAPGPEHIARVRGGEVGALVPVRPCGTSGVELLAAAPDGALAATCQTAHGAAVAISTDDGRSFGVRKPLPGTVAQESAYVLPVSSRVLLARVGNRAPGNTYYRSADGGRTWHVVATDDATQTMFGWQMFDARNGYRTQPYGNGLYLTHDGGVTWTAAPFAQ